jgi:EAL domain-containing protein (putative c-di-GMP-specific phosphodiesterase class I)
MIVKSTFSNLVRAEDGSYSTAYGPFVLKSALQPIFHQHEGGLLDIGAFEGFVRPFRDDEPVAPKQFFPLVAQRDIADVDSILRTIHILNTGRLQRARAKIFVNFHPGLFRNPQDMRHEVDRMRIAANEAGMGPDRIVCEISEKAGDDAPVLLHFVDSLRDIGFRIAIDEYGAGDSDLERVKLLKPDYVKFEAAWVRDFLDNSAGFALLNVIVRQFIDAGTQPVFEGLEEIWQVDLCAELQVPLLQGYAMARPELAPTSFDLRFPELVLPLEEPVAREPARGSMVFEPPRFGETERRSDLRAAKPARAFGKRQF